MSFKLIAIQPLHGHNANFIKNLHPNTVYQFYSDYQFNKNKSGNITEVIYKERVPKSLYEEKVNISAIVGKNGSGKSALVELLYVTFYKISRILEILDAEETDFSEIEDFKPEIFEIAFGHFKQIFENKTTENRDSNLKESAKNLVGNLNRFIRPKTKLKEYDKYTTDLGINIFYEIENEIFCLGIKEESLSLFSYTNGTIDISTKIKLRENAKKIFYNLVINYSIYGLNSEESGNWIEKLFHKNDSYQTPIVINPFRDKGNIDINTENYLVRQRLLAIVFSKEIIHSNELIENKTIQKIKFRYRNKSNYEYNLNEPTFINNIFPKLYQKFFNEVFIDYKQETIYQESVIYIINKICSITERYNTFSEFKDFDSGDEEQLEGLVNLLYEDRSHITLKLRQALNFYKYQNYIDSQTVNLQEYNQEYTFKEIFDKINSQITLPDDHLFTYLIEYLPPSFIDIELYFDEDENNSLSNLSSGEKQRIYSLNSIIYHLRNLLSVNFNRKKEDLIIYSNFNIILDEIELYYHPEQQKSFVKDLLDYIKKIDFKDLYKGYIPNINILFITHSPFILSDIPKQNVLFLKKGLPSEDFSNKNTFGANINDLLSNSFFFEHNDSKLLMGEFAKNKINEIIDWLNEKEVSPENKKEYKKIIDLIDEPLLKNKLEEMYFSRFPNEFDEKLEIEKLKVRAIELGLKIKEND